MFSRKRISLNQLKTVYIIGVCGTLMGAFAAFLRKRGIQVIGSDANIYPPMSEVLEKAGVELLSGYHADHLAQMKKADLIIVGNVISKENPEAKAVMDADLEMMSLPAFMEKALLPETQNIVVAGTHGKTTTSSLLSFVLKRCGKDPSYFIGGVSPDLPESFFVGTGEQFVLEGDEYDTAFFDKVPKFFHYLPDHVILTSIEFDHADIYKDIAAVEDAFRSLTEKIRKPGHLIACVDYPIIRKLIDGLDFPCVTYGCREKSAQYLIKNVKVLEQKTTFDIVEQGKKIESLESQLPGAYNSLNVLSVWLQCRELGLPSDQVKKALKEFQGVKRRQEVRGQVAGVTVIDDFAHHPTAVHETLTALQEKYRGRRLIAVFEPRSATSRRSVFQKEYANAFDSADVLYFSKPFDQTKIPEKQRFSTEKLVFDIRARDPQKAVHLFDQVDQGVSDLSSHAVSGDVIAVLSNGGFEGFIPKLLEKLKSRT